MSFRPDHISSFKVSEGSVSADALSQKSESEILSLFKDILDNGVHGFCYSVYEEGQKPGDIISEAQVHRRMSILKNHCGWVRSFSCIEGNEWVPKVARQYGLKTLVGAWLGTDEEKNREEIESLIQLAKDGYIDIAAVGNEVLYRNDLDKAQLIAYINEVKQAIPDIPVGYVDAYYEFSVHQDIVEISDVILCNCYPFWEGTPFEYAIQHMQQMYQQAVNAAQGKPVIITETGWPSQGGNIKSSQPGEEQALRYFILTQLWVLAQEIPCFYFSSFDESWKVDAEGSVGAYWGIWDSKGRLKYPVV